MSQELVRLRNNSRLDQSVYVDGEELIVVPRGTIVVPSDHYALKIRELERVELNGADQVQTSGPQDNGPSREELMAMLQQMQAQIDANAAEARVNEQALRARAERVGEREQDSTARASEPQDVEIQYPRHLSGGKFELSDGTVTKGGTSKEDAQKLEAELHEEE